MKNLVKNFSSFISEMKNYRKSDCCGAQIIVEEGICSECGESVDLGYVESDDLDNSDLWEDPTFEAKKPNRKAVLKAAEEKYPTKTAASMKKTLKKMSDGDFEEKAKKYFSWADDPAAAAAAFIRKATKKEPRDA